MICPAPCRQQIRGANKMKVAGIWRHKNCPHSVWQPEELARATKNAARMKTIWDMANQ